jgi:excinuclease UvrABC nuclease subunit
MVLGNIKKLALPDAPGVYFWKEGETILYIGRATSLRDRVKSYFAGDLIATRGPRIVDMVTRATSIEWQEADSVLEAVIAEANLIKKYQPYYNVKEKDDRSWNYVVITREDFPRVLIIRGRVLDVENQKKLARPNRIGRLGATIKVAYTFGPFPQTLVLREALRIIRRMFPFIDRSSAKKDNYHFYRQIGLTPDTASDEAKAEYRKTIRHITLFFQGKKQELVRTLKREMNVYAKSREFEKAEETKRKLFALDHIQDIALVKEDISRVGEGDRKGFRIEAYDVAHMSGKENVGVMTVMVDGEIAKNEYRKFKLDPDIGNDDVWSLREILSRRFSHPEWRFPDIAVIDGGAGQRNAAEKFFTDAKLSISVVAVVKDDAHKAREILGEPSLVKKYEKSILLANVEAHRFAIAYHRKLRKIKRSPRVI